MWCLCKDFDVLIKKKTWSTRFDRSYMFRLVKNCKLLKSQAKEWNKYQLGNIFRQIAEVDNALLEIQSKTIYF